MTKRDGVKHRHKMTKSWRPEGWERPYKFISTPSLEQLARAEQTDEVRFLENEAYEAGADAMLKALEARGLYITFDGRIIDEYVPKERE